MRDEMRREERKRRDAAKGCEADLRPTFPWQTSNHQSTPRQAAATPVNTSPSSALWGDAIYVSCFAFALDERERRADRPFPSTVRLISSVLDLHTLI